ncbi:MULTISPECIES: hypothetical protein [unclassified Cryobacterium]|uniref:hypothetical protein n=1 Tax=unclassified Cryobacterium TaxID=2649013 RepID=UPI00106CE883|nr:MULTISPECIES: hypothetical protein [unclassified Cryobacterium]TFD07623.1 hypothetical protein E3T29_07035 [Cryobacterium sp. TMT1-66-1]TFD08088.1 hypothetical protein E3T35_19060 [Cryobacterium sp. TMT1-2-2]
MVEHLGQQLTALVEELRTVAGPDAAEAQIESVTTEAAERVAAASARASRAGEAQRQAEAERGEREQALDRAMAELTAACSAAEVQSTQVQAELSQLREQLVVLHTRVGEAEHERDDATARRDCLCRPS